MKNTFYVFISIDISLALGTVKDRQIENEWLSLTSSLTDRQWPRLDSNYVSVVSDKVLSII